MAIQIKDASELGRLLTAVSQELANATIFFRMFIDINDAQREFQEEMGESYTFWFQTMQAHLDATLLRLCQNIRSKKHHAGLPGLLDTIKSNRHLFTAEEFAKRMEGSQAAETLIAEKRSLDWTILTEVDIKKVDANKNPRVKILIGIRNHFYSHRNAEDVIRNRSVRDLYP